MDRRELNILSRLDGILRQKSIRQIIDSIVVRVEQKLKQDSEEKLAWESIPLDAYGEQLPDIIRSSWVFVVRAQTKTGAERHPNSHQRMMSYKGTGDLQIWNNGEWESNLLISNFIEGIGKRWVSVLPNVWHQAVTFKKNWVVVSFHTVPDKELIEERPDPKDSELTQQRKYLNKK